jgi:hypothetical protein
MIDLTPIDKRIQKKLFQKMRLLGRDGNAPGKTINVGGLTHNQLALRTPFVRMTSGLENPVILMGGELTSDSTDSEGNMTLLGNTGRLAAGYDEIYGPRSYYDPDDFFQENDLGENKFKRPMPGVKSIDVQFKGGVRALREGTISWTCWSFDDINRLSPHFLSHGTTVMLEWGWVYGNDGLSKLPTIIDSKNKIKRDAFTNYEEVVQEADGNFDFMLGIVKNFEYTTRDDGAFDCQTIITSVGASILNTVTPTNSSKNTTVNLNIRKNQTEKELKENLEKAQDDDSLISYDTGVTLKSFIAHMYRYLREDLYKNPDEYQSKLKDSYIEKKFGNTKYNSKAGKHTSTDGKSFGSFYIRPNAFIYEMDNRTIESAWVRWGWFEDNILSKFLTLASDSDINPFVTQFRSVEYVKDDDNKKILEGEEAKLESTRIRTHKQLRTVNINRYILPGKLEPFKLQGDSKRISGDTDRMIKLALIVNNSDNFRPFDDGDTGFLRNMLINVDTIQEAFQAKNSNDYTIETLNVSEALESLFELLNQDIDFWDFQITQDQTETTRSKIIDTQVTAIAFDDDVKIDNTINQNKGTKSIYDNTSDEVKNNGVFFFPVWQKDSMVKRQNITAKIPDAMALSIMYGANYDDIKTANTLPPEASSQEASALAGIYKDYVNKNSDQSLENIEIALRKDGFNKIGTNERNENLLLTKDGSTDDVIGYLMKKGNGRISIAAKMNEKYQERIDDINEQMYEAKALEEEKRLAGLIDDPSITYPLPNDFVSAYPHQFLMLIDAESDTFRTLYNSVFHDNGQMKSIFLNTISDAVSVVSQDNRVSADNTRPIIIPLDIELEVDGIGGIIPGNSFHSTYLPKRYQEETLFQAFDVNHKVDGAGWSVTLSGKMRSTFNKMTQTDIKKELKSNIDKLLAKAAAEDEVIEIEQQAKLIEAKKDFMYGGGNTTTGFIIRNIFKLFGKET